ncbi:hypothetical protein LXL04_029723 [Taraxacum kok-saghyz]
MLMNPNSPKMPFPHAPQHFQQNVMVNFQMFIYVFLVNNQHFNQFLPNKPKNHLRHHQSKFKRERKGKQVAEAKVHIGPQTWTGKEIVALSQTWCATSKKQCLWEWCEGGRLLGKWYDGIIETFNWIKLRFLEPENANAFLWIHNTHMKAHVTASYFAAAGTLCPTRRSSMLFNSIRFGRSSHQHFNLAITSMAVEHLRNKCTSSSSRELHIGHKGETPSIFLLIRFNFVGSLPNLALHTRMLILLGTPFFHQVGRFMLCR